MPMRPNAAAWPRRQFVPFVLLSALAVSACSAQTEYVVRQQPIEIVSNQAGATIEIDGTAIGTAPVIYQREVRVRSDEHDTPLAKGLRYTGLGFMAVGLGAAPAATSSDDSMAALAIEGSGLVLLLAGIVVQKLWMRDLSLEASVPASTVVARFDDGRVVRRLLPEVTEVYEADDPWTLSVGGASDVSGPEPARTPIEAPGATTPAENPTVTELEGPMPTRPASAARRVVFGANLAVPIVDHASLGSTCSSPESNTCEGSSALDKLNGSSRVDVEGFVLVRTSESTRVGLGLTIRPGVQFESLESHEIRNYGTTLDTTLTAEWLPQITSNVRWLLQGRAGVRTMFASEDTATLNQKLEIICIDARSNGLSCTVDGGPYSGFLIGAGAGLVWGSGPLKWRTQLFWTMTEIDDLSRTQLPGYSGSVDLGAGDSWRTISLAFGLEY